MLTHIGKVNSHVYFKKTCKDHLKAVFLSKPACFIVHKKTSFLGFIPFHLCRIVEK
jgi:hypothetical protein